MPFLDRLPDPIPVALTGNPLDRADAMRDRADALSQALRRPDARVLALHGGKPPILLEPTPRLAWAAVSDAALEAALGPPLLLGLAADGGARFALDLREAEAPEELGLWPETPKFIDLRSIAADLPAGESAVTAQAKSLLSWHATHRFCANCGAPSVAARGGWRRDCPACDAKHFPRTDPVVIMLVEHRSAQHGARTIVGRQRHWPEGMHSLLAGFVEPGETIEEAVRRETHEEAGVRVGRVAVAASQPWPFPSTLMIGCFAEALDDRLTPDLTELENALWVNKADMVRALRGEHPWMLAPRRDAIARTLVEAWVEGRFD